MSSSNIERSFLKTFHPRTLFVTSFQLYREFEKLLLDEHAIQVPLIDKGSRSFDLGSLESAL
jgi:hypothetical protein